MSISGKTAIAGVGVTAFGKLPGRSAWSLQTEAVKRAIDDAGLTKADIDGLLTAPPLAEPLLLHAEQLGGKLGLRTNYLSQKFIGGATAVALVAEAALAVEAGLCEVAVCVYGENAKTGLPMLFGRAQMGRGQAPSDDIAYGLAGGPIMEARAAKRYMNEFGVTEEMLGSVAVAFREHASRNPGATYRDPLTIEQYLQNRYVSEPLRVLDCTIGASDGAVAVVVTSSERARDLAKPPAVIAGAGVAANLQGLSDPDHYTSYPGARSAATAYRMAGLEPEDVDVAQFYDCFTSTVLITMEDYGFCKRGEAGPFALEGNLKRGGALPSNTSGGMLSEANLVGWNVLAEGVRQIRGESTSQVDDAEVCVVAGQGGFHAAHATLLLTKGAA
ncbi:MAG: thiolase family protein [Actinomycetota bacterium]